MVTTAVLKSPNKWKKRNSWKHIYLLAKQKRYHSYILQKNLKYKQKKLQNKQLNFIYRIDTMIEIPQPTHISAKQILKYYNIVIVIKKIPKTTTETTDKVDNVSDDNSQNTN